LRPPAFSGRRLSCRHEEHPQQSETTPPAESSTGIHSIEVVDI
jgi:hypothetical protein